MELFNKIFPLPDSWLENYSISTGKRRIFLNTILKKENIRNLLRFYYKLGDQASRNLFVTIVIKSIRQALLNTSDKYVFICRTDWLKMEERARTLAPAESYPLDMIETFLLEGYKYNDKCCAQPGDVVLDCGAFTGNTAIYFSKTVGAEGKVIAFEAIPDIYRELCSNISQKSKNIICENLALSDINGMLRFSSQGQSSHQAQEGIEVPAIPIDHYVQERSIRKLDFIKMDIEGSELQALNGASNTIRNFLPKLAICVYHKPDDFITIPAKILELDERYTFYLKHNSHNFLETVLFGIPTGEKVKEPSISELEAEGTAISAVWSNILANHFIVARTRRKLLLELYDAHLEIINHFFRRLKSARSVSESSLSYLVSDNGKLNYEFRFEANQLNISLNLDKTVPNSALALDEIICAWPLAENLKKKSGTAPCISYIVNNLSDYEGIAKIMNCLIIVSWPILEKYHLLPDRMILEKALK